MIPIERIVSHVVRHANVRDDLNREYRLEFCHTFGEARAEWPSATGLVSLWVADGSLVHALHRAVGADVRRWEPIALKSVAEILLAREVASDPRAERVAHAVEAWQNLAAMVAPETEAERMRAAIRFSLRTVVGVTDPALESDFITLLQPQLVVDWKHKMSVHAGMRRDLRRRLLSVTDIADDRETLMETIIALLKLSLD